MLHPVWQVEIDSTTRADWSGMLDLFNDASIYQTWSYGQVRWGAKNLSHIVVKRDGEVVGMAQLRIIRPTRFKFGMAYLRWGPLFERRGKPLDEEVLTHVAQALEEEYVSKRRLLLHVLPNAFAGSQRANLIESAFSKFKSLQLVATDSYRTFLLDLSPSLAELRQDLDKKWRNMLTQSEKKGLRVVAGRSSEEYRTFCQMYYEMRRRKAFDTAVDVEEFARVQEDLPVPHRMQVFIAELDGIPVAGIVCSAMGDSGIYLLGATADSGLNSRGAYLLQWTAVQWLQERGVRWYDLGGIDPEHNPGVYSFKKGLSGADVQQVRPLVACDSVLSAAVVRAGLTVRRSFHNGFAALQARPLKQRAAGS